MEGTFPLPHGAKSDFTTLEGGFRVNRKGLNRVSDRSWLNLFGDRMGLS